MPPRSRRRPTRQATGATTQRGYGRDHQARRTRLLAAHVEGAPCRKCGAPMYVSQGLDAGHGDPRALNKSSIADALEHSWCNRGEGASIKAEVAKRDAAATTSADLAALAANRAQRQSYCARKW